MASDRPPVRWFAGACSLALLWTLVACAHDPAGDRLISEQDLGRPRLAAGGDPQEAARFFPLAPGARWSYQIVRREGTTGHEVKIVAAEAGVFTDSDGVKWSVDRYGLRDPYRYFIKLPARAGQRWQANLSINMAERFRILADDAVVETPAGRFTGCLVVESRSWLPSQEERILRRVYAPGVGLVRSITFTLAQGGRAVPIVDMQLVTYELPPAAQP